MLTEITLHIDDSIFISLKNDKKTFAEDMLFQHALRLYRQHKLSIGKAAELAGYSRIGFIQQLQAMNEPIFDYDDVLVTEMIESARQTPSLIIE